MSIMKNGLWSGALGPVVQCSWKGRPYLRAKPSYVNDPKTPAQLTQRSKMQQCHHFVQQLLTVVRMGYAGFTQNMSAYNACMSQVMRQACVGTHPDAQIDYTRVLLGQGPLSVAHGVTLSAQGREVTLAWQPLMATGNGHGTDRVLCVFYNQTRNMAYFRLLQEQRSGGSLTAQLPTEWQGEQVHAYLGFQSVDGALVSNIVHVGMVRWVQEDEEIDLHLAVVPAAMPATVAAAVNPNSVSARALINGVELPAVRGGVPITNRRQRASIHQRW